MSVTFLGAHSSDHIISGGSGTGIAVYYPWDDWHSAFGGLQDGDMIVLAPRALTDERPVDPYSGTFPGITGTSAVGAADGFHSGLGTSGGTDFMFLATTGQSFEYTPGDESGRLGIGFTAASAHFMTNGCRMSCHLTAAAFRSSLRIPGVAKISTGYHDIVSQDFDIRTGTNQAIGPAVPFSTSAFLSRPLQPTRMISFFDWNSAVEGLVSPDESRASTIVQTGDWTHPDASSGSMGGCLIVSGEFVPVLGLGPGPVDHINAAGTNPSVGNYTGIRYWTGELEALMASTTVNQADKVNFAYSYSFLEMAPNPGQELQSRSWSAKW